MKGRTQLIASVALVLCCSTPALPVQAAPATAALGWEVLATVLEQTLAFFGLPGGEAGTPGETAFAEGESPAPTAPEGGYIIEPFG